MKKEEEKIKTTSEQEKKIIIKKSKFSTINIKDLDDLIFADIEVKLHSE